MICRQDELKCPNSYCIPLRRRCDDTWDCPNGEDEDFCGKIEKKEEEEEDFDHQIRLYIRMKFEFLEPFHQHQHHSYKAHLIRGCYIHATSPIKLIFGIPSREIE